MSVTLAWPLLADSTAPSACHEMIKGHSPLLDAPASATDVRYLQCTGSDKVVFRDLRPFPAQDISDLFQKRWESHGWFPQPGEDDAWHRVVSPDRRRVEAVRKLYCKNMKGYTATLILTYDRRFTDPVVDTIDTEMIDLGNELQVSASVDTVLK